MDTYVAQTPTIRTSRILVGIIAVAIVGALAFAVALATRAISFDSLATKPAQAVLVGADTGTGAGYPPHYGLAGPSGVDRAAPMGGVPAHGGLAGPSGAGSTSNPMGGVPAHGGLAGPSVVRDTNAPMGGVPAHGGLAGPSGVGSSQ